MLVGELVDEVLGEAVGGGVFVLAEEAVRPRLLEGPELGTTALFDSGDVDALESPRSPWGWIAGAAVSERTRGPTPGLPTVPPPPLIDPWTS